MSRFFCSEKNKKIIKNIFIYINIFYIFLTVVLYFVGNIERIGYLSEFKLISNNSSNYIYNFRISYNSKIFRNSDLYNVYPNIIKAKNDNEFIKDIKMHEIGSPFGTLISSSKIEQNKIENINYTLGLKRIYYKIFLIISLYLITLFQPVKNLLININNSLTLSKKQYIIFATIITTVLFIFHFWLGFPGYFYNADNITILNHSVTKNYFNWHPVIIPVTLNFLYQIFGQHTFYITFINLACLYLGLLFIIIGLYLKYNKKRAIFLLFIILISDIYFTLFTQLKDITCSLYIWLAASLILFTILVHVKNNTANILIYIFISLLLLIALLWRKNAIVTIYPIILFLIFLIIKKLNLNNFKKNIISFISISLLFAILMIAIVKLHPYIWIKSNEGFYYKNINMEEIYKKYNKLDLYTWWNINDRYGRDLVNHVYISHIIELSVKNNDDSMIPLEWYDNNKTFEDLKKAYIDTEEFYYYRLVFYLNSNRIFKLGYLENINKVWIKYILKYPLDYLKYVIRFSYSITMKKNPWIRTSSYLTFELPKNLLELNFKDQHISKDNFRIKIYDFIYYGLSINIPTNIFILLSTILFIYSIYLNIKFNLNNNIILYLFFITFSSIATFIIVSLFSPNNDPRYLYPIIPNTLLALIIFIIHKTDRNNSYMNHNFKNK